MRLRHCVGASVREIALSVGIARSTVAEYIYRSDAAGLRWPLPDGHSDEDLERLLFPSTPAEDEPSRPLPSWPEIQAQLARKGVTLLLVWQEYKEANPEGYGYSRFASLYREWQGRTELRMRRHHKAGEKQFVDFVGLTMPVTDPKTSQVRQVAIFASALGASQRIFARAYESQTLECWL